MSLISWTDITANPIHIVRKDGTNGGHFCRKVSLGCLHCYSEAQNQSSYFSFASKLAYAGQAPENLIFDDAVMKKLLRMRSGKKVFLCSMTDLFGEWVPNEWIDKAFAYMAFARQHIFQVLTKRPERMQQYLSDREAVYRIEEAGYSFTHNMDCLHNWPLPNVWLGTSTENQEAADQRIPHLLNTPAVVRFLSCEPLLEKIDLSELLSYGIRQTSRRSHLSGDFRQGNRDRFRGQHLEDRQEGMGQVESMHSTEQVQAGTSRNKKFGLSACQSDVQQSEVSDGCSPPSVPTLLRQDSRRDDHQSQRWQQEEQPSIEPGVSNVFPTAATRIVCSQEGQSVESVGRKEFDVQTDISSSTGNQAEESVRGISEIDSTRLQDQIPSSVQNMPRAAMEGNFWVIVGGESGSKSRPCHSHWIELIVTQCQQQSVAVFVKQWGQNAIGYAPYIDGVTVCHSRIKLKDRKGGDMAEWPKNIRVRQFPIVQD